MAFQRVYVEPCGKGFGYDLLIDNSVTSISVGQTYFISGTTGQPPKQQQIVGCFSVKNIKDVQSGPADSLTFSTPYLGCEECELANANFILLRTCFDSQYGQIIINIGDITPTPSIDDVFLMEVIILDDFGGSIRLTSCFSVSGFLSSNFDFNPTGVLSYSSRTDCQDCLNNSPIIHEVYDCIDSNEPYYIAFPSTGFQDHLITFTDLFGITQYCGTVKGQVGDVAITGLLVTDLGKPDETGIKCDDCLANVAEKKKLQNCIDSDEIQIVWASSLFQPDNSTHLSNANGCYTVLPDVVPPEEPITVNELANFDPQNNCEDCLECYGIEFDFVTCEEIEVFEPVNQINTNGAGFNFLSREITIDSSNKLFAVFQNSGRIAKYNLGTLSWEENSVPVLVNPWGIAINETDGIICVSNLSTNQVTFFDYNNINLSNSISVPLFSGQKVYFDPIGSKFYVVFANTGVPNIAVFGGSSYLGMSYIIFGSSSARYTDVVRIGTGIYCLNYSNQQLEVYDLSYTLINTYGLTGKPLSLDVDYINTTIYIATNASRYIKFNYTTISFVDVNYSPNCVTDEQKIKIEPSTNLLYITDVNCNHIYIFDLTTDTLVRSVTNFDNQYGINSIYGMALDTSNNIWFGSNVRIFQTQTSNQFVNGSSSTNELLTVGQTFFNPVLSACCEVTDTNSITNDSFLNITEYPSILNFNDCTECLSTPVESFVCIDCITGNEAILVAPAGTFIIGNYVRSQYGNSDWLCFEIVDNYTVENYGDLFKLESNGVVYSSCEECQSGATIGITLINTETLQQEQYNITLDVWYRIVGFPFSLPLSCLSDKNGVCYQVINACPIDNVHPLFEPGDFFLNQSLCRLNSERLPVSAGTEYLVCQICEDCCGSGTTATLIVPPHPVWTRPNGQQVTLLDAVALGGMFGLNN
jgi:hypothetical protein